MTIAYALKTIIVLLFVTSFLASCTRDLLDEKPSSSIVIPSTLKDFQLLLDNSTPMCEMPEIGEISSDDFYWSSDYLPNLPNAISNAHTWQVDIFEGQGNVYDWNAMYQQVFYCNIILEGLDKIEITAQNEKNYNQIKGSALFLRALAFYTVAQIWAPPYNKSSEDKDMGIPIRLTADVNPPSNRSSLKKTYDQILSDLKESEKLLTNSIDYNIPTRPSRPAMFALYAKVYLTMKDYTNSEKYANLCLELHNDLLDYNSLNSSSNTPFTTLNKEVILQRYLNQRGVLFPGDMNANIDSTLYKTYDDDDLRRIIYYRIGSDGHIYRKNDYSGIFVLFAGIATDEVILTRAECFARNGKVDLAMKDLNDLLRSRWRKNIDGTTTYKDQTAPDGNGALDIILLERRKSLINRGIRWTDLRRLNSAGANITLKRVINGQEYTLPPNDKRWTLPIPPDVIALTGIPQNER